MSRILANGITQSLLVDLLALIRTNWNGILAKLDADGGITDTDYAAKHTLTLPSGIQTTGVKAILHQGEVVLLLDDFITEYNATLTKLDADTGITDTNYSSTLAITDIVGNSKVDGIIPAGVYQGNVIWLLNHIIARIAALTAKLDDDAGITDTNYAATWDISDTVVEESSKARPRISGAGGILFALALGAASLVSARPIVEGDVISLQGAATHYQIPVDVGRLERFSLHAAYEAAAPATLSGTGADVNSTTERITKAGHGFTEAMAVLFSTTAGSPPGGLTHGTTYYVIRVNKDQIQLSTGTTEAMDGLEVNLTAQTSTNTFTLAPLAFAGTPSFKWQASNNATDWFDLNVTSITWSAASNTLWEWTAPTFKWIRLNLLGPTTGGLKLGVTLHGREN